MKFSKRCQHILINWKALLNTYFLSGEHRPMLTVVGKDDLIRAIKHPETISESDFRVGRVQRPFVNLSPAVQEEILKQTLY